MPTLHVREEVLGLLTRIFTVPKKTGMALLAQAQLASPWARLALLERCHAPPPRGHTVVLHASTPLKNICSNLAMGSPLAMVSSPVWSEPCGSLADLFIAENLCD